MRRLGLLALFVLPIVVAACGSSPIADSPVPRAAKEQTAPLDWVESAGAPGSRLVMRVRRFTVTRDGWRAAISVTNDTTTAFTIERGEDTPEFGFGVMLFGTGSHAELEQRNAQRVLPVLRRADVFDPPLPTVLSPAATWSGTASGPGALPGGLWVRFVFGAFKPRGTMPQSLAKQGVRDFLIWITDHTHRLRT